MERDAQLLKEKALLLLSRERELLSLRRRHARVSAWLTVAHSLSELVSARSPSGDAYSALADKLMTLLQLQRVTFFGVGPSGLQPLMGSTREARTLEPLARQLLETEEVGLCNAPDNEALDALSRAVGLHRFMWCRLGDGTGPPLLLVAGYEREKAGFYAPFEEADFGHFRSMGQHFSLELRNAELIKQLELEKRHLEDLNQTLERRVAERTEDFARANRGLADALAVLRERDRRMHEDLEQARLFQQSILPAAPRSERLEMRSVYRPLELVGGDIFDISPVDDGAEHLRVFIADATGHGVQASLRTIVIKSEYDRLKGDHTTPDEVLVQLNSRLAQQYSPGEMLCTACCFDLAPAAGGITHLRYANCAHPALLRVTGSRVEEIYRDGPFLGLAPEIQVDIERVELREGDALLAYTDGLCDQMNGSRRSFPLAEAAIEALEDTPPMAEVLARIIDAFDAFREAAPVADDVTLIGARVRNV
jgi:serine phosphatase RsbU (regulator of sigma subunit)